MKRFNYALLYLKRNPKMTFLVFVISFIMINLIIITLSLYKVSVATKNYSVDAIDYHVKMSGDVCEGVYEDNQGIYNKIKALKRELDEFKDFEGVNKIEYHLVVNAYGKEGDLEENKNRFYGQDDLQDGEIIVYEGYLNDDGQKAQKGDTLSFILPVFANDYPLKDEIIYSEEVTFKVIDTYQKEDEYSFDPLYINNDEVLKIMERLYEIRKDNIDKRYFLNDDGSIYEPMIYQPVIYADDYPSLLKINDYLRKLTVSFNTSSGEAGSLKVESTIDEALKVVGSINNYSYIIIAILLVLLLALIIAFNTILNIFLKDRRREFAIRISLGDDIKAVKTQCFKELMCVYLAAYLITFGVASYISHLILQEIKELNLNEQRAIFIADNRYAEFERLNTAINSIYDIKIDHIVILAAFLIGIIIIGGIVNFSFRKFNRIELTNLLRNE